jgi:hypothetical protein
LEDGHDFTRVQGSVYQREDTLPAIAWVAMLSLRAVEPLGVFSSVVKAVQMFHIPLPIMIASEPIKLGGMYCPQLVSPTPLNLVPPGVPTAPLPHAPNPLPRDVAHNADSQLGANW